MFDPAKDAIDDHLRDGEKIVWAGQPVRTQSTRVTLPITYLFVVVAVGILMYGAYLAYQDYLRLTEGIDVNSRVFNDALIYILRENLVYLLGGLIIFLLAYFLKFLTRKDLHIYYGLTDQRALIINRDGKKEMLQQWGPGEIRKVSMAKQGQSSGDVLFAQDIADYGELEDASLDRSPVDWIGFKNVEDVKYVYGQIIEWKKRFEGKTRTLKNGKMGFALEIPMDWTGHTAINEQKIRDEVCLGLMISELGGRNRLPREAHLDEEAWNTLILMKRLDAEMKEDIGRLNFQVILVEAAWRNERPEKIGYKKDIAKASILDFEKNPGFYYETLKRMLFVTELDAPSKVDKVKETTTLLLHPEAKPHSSIKGMTAYELEGAISLMKRGFLFKQVFAYFNAEKQIFSRFGKRKSLHIRFTFFCSDQEKGKIYAKNVGMFDRLVASNQLLFLRQVEAEVSEEPAPDQELG